MLFVANWKMYKPYSDAVVFIKEHRTALHTLATKPDTQLVICPSFDALSAIQTVCTDTALVLGAQDCAAYQTGAYTGQVSAASVAQLGCRYCIVGHSERRQHCGETSELVAQKVLRLLEQNICPIVCIGETKDAYEQGQTKKVLHEQLMPVLATLHGAGHTAAQLAIAYEPVWSIGTGIIPTNDYLTQVYTAIVQIVAQQLPDAQITLLYGGSVNPDNVAKLRSTPAIEGFLIGGASTDFQKLQKIVS